MDTKRLAVKRWMGLQTFSWARFAVMMALIGTPCIACAWLFIRQPAPDLAHAVPAAVQANSRPLVILIPSRSDAAQRNGVQDASTTPAPSRATTSLSPGTQKQVVQVCAQPCAAPHVAQPPTAQPSGMPTGEAALEHVVATADIKEGAAGKPASLPSLVIQTAATNPAVPQLPPPQLPPPQLPPLQLPPLQLPPLQLPSPGEVTSAPVGPPSNLPPDAVKPPPPSPSLVLPASGSCPQDAKKPLPPNPTLEFPAPNILPIGTLPNHPMPSSVWSPLADLPQPTEQELEAIRNHVEGIVDPNCILDLELGRTRLLKLKKPARSVQVSGKEVIKCTPVNGRELAIQARAVGTTVLHLTFGDADNAQEVEVRYLVRVFPALAAREPYEAVFQALDAKIAEIFLESKVHLKLVGEAILITGQVRDARDATAIVQLVVANTPWADRHATGPGTPVAGSGSPHVINQLQIAHAAQHQLTLKVVVVELSRSALWSLSGKGLEVNGSGASLDTKHVAGSIAPVVYAVSDGSMSAVGGAMALSSVKLANGMDGQPMPAPRQILLHGQPATVVASGQCLVTASPDKAPAQQRSVTLGLHGIDLSFTPIAVEGESLRMTVAASAGPPGTGRQVNSTVAAVREGKTLAFAGLLPPVAQERDPRRAAGPWRIFDRFTSVEQPTASVRETIVLILPEAVGTR